jgi:hypothetical protein
MTTAWQMGFFDRDERLAKLDKLYDIFAELERFPSGFVDTCRVPDGGICERQHPLFMALHKNARTTLAVRAEISASKDSLVVLACAGRAQIVFDVGSRSIPDWTRSSASCPRGARVPRAMCAYSNMGF